MTREQEACPKCGQPMRQSGSGSITQWMFACTCSLNVETETQDFLDLCIRCGKRIGAGREGSLTQFIFRASLCECAEPVPSTAAKPSQELQVAQRHQLLSNLELNFDENDESGEQEISLDANTFPVDRYKPLAELGRGAAGRVHLCRDRMLKKLVAVKSLSQISTDQLVSFQLEAKANSSLSHKNIIKVLDFGATEYGCPFMVMQFVNGISMEQFLETYGPMNELLASRVFGQVCEALNYVHGKQIFHRDLKPSNILLTPHEELENDWDARLIDFGVAGVKKDQEPTIVQGQTVVGTPTYMSPDQLHNRPFDSRSETYSVGCMLFEALTGRPPFIGETALSLASMHANEAPPAMADVCDLKFSPQMEDIVAKALTKNPDDRYQSARQMQSALQEIERSEESVVELFKSDEEVEYDSESELDVESAPTSRRSKLILLGAVSLAGAALVAVTIPLWSELNSTNTPAIEVKKDTTDLVYKHKEVEGTVSIENGWHVLKGPWKTQDFRKLALKEPILKLHFLHADVDWSGLVALKGMDVTDVTIEETKFSSKDLKHLATLQKLNYLTLMEKDLRGDGLASLSGLNSLNTIIIEDSQIDAQGWKALGQIKSLRKIAASETKGWSGEDIKPLEQLPLVSLDVQITPLGDEGMEYLSSIRSLNSLEVNDCHLTDTGAKYLGRLTNLNNLYMKSNDISDKGLMYLKDLKKLSILRAHDTKVTPSGVAKLRESCPQILDEVLKRDGIRLDVDKLTDDEPVKVRNRF